MGVIPKAQLFFTLLHLFLLITSTPKTDSINIPSGSIYLYEVEIDKGITFKSKIDLSENKVPIIVEIYDPDGEIIEKMTVLADLELNFVTVTAGTYEIKFYNMVSESSVELLFSYNVQREIPVIPSFPPWSLFIGLLLFFAQLHQSKENLRARANSTYHRLNRIE